MRDRGSVPLLSTFTQDPVDSVHIHPHVPPIQPYPLPGPKTRWQSALRHGPDTLTVQHPYRYIEPRIHQWNPSVRIHQPRSLPYTNNRTPGSEAQVRTVNGTTQVPARTWTGRLHCYLSARLGKKSRQRWVELLSTTGDKRSSSSNAEAARIMVPVLVPVPLLCWVEWMVNGAALSCAARF